MSLRRSVSEMLRFTMASSPIRTVIWHSGPAPLGAPASPGEEDCREAELSLRLWDLRDLWWDLPGSASCLLLPSSAPSDPSLDLFLCLSELSRWFLIGRGPPLGRV